MAWGCGRNNPLETIYWDRRKFGTSNLVPHHAPTPFGEDSEASISDCICSTFVCQEYSCTSGFPSFGLGRTRSCSYIRCKFVGNEHGLVLGPQIVCMGRIAVRQYRGKEREDFDEARTKRSAMGALSLIFLCVKATSFPCVPETRAHCSIDCLDERNLNSSSYIEEN